MNLPKILWVGEFCVKEPDRTDQQVREELRQDVSLTWPLARHLCAVLLSVAAPRAGHHLSTLHATFHSLTFCNNPVGWMSLFLLSKMRKLRLIKFKFLKITQAVNNKSCGLNAVHLLPSPLLFLLPFAPIQPGSLSPRLWITCKVRTQAKHTGLQGQRSLLPHSQ